MMNALVSSEGSEDVGEEGTIRGSRHDEDKAGEVVEVTVVIGKLVAVLSSREVVVYDYPASG